MLTFRKASAFAFIGFIQALSVQAAYSAPVTQPSYSLREIDVFDDYDLLEARQVCALGKMPEAMRRTKATGLVTNKLPDVDAYCLKAIDATRAKNRWPDLYIKLALMEQGYIDFDSAELAPYLKKNEAPRTMGAILQAANAGQATYTSITGKARALPCALALDAGATWAATAANAKAPVALTQTEAAAIARQCYDPSVTSIVVKGTAMPAAKAGLMVGAWLGKNG